jgi:hypothetical protein
MLVCFSPVRSDETLEARVSGDVLTVNGQPFDFGPLPEGATLPDGACGSDWIAGPVERRGGVVAVTLRLPHGLAAPAARRFPQPVVVTAGPVPLPPETE